MFAAAEGVCPGVLCICVKSLASEVNVSICSVIARFSVKLINCTGMFRITDAIVSFKALRHMRSSKFGLARKVLSILVPDDGVDQGCCMETRTGTRQARNSAFRE